MRTVLAIFIAAATLQAIPATAGGDDRIVTGAGAGGGPHVQTFRLERGNPDGIREASFFAYSRQFRGGVAVAGGLDGARRLVVTGPASAGAPHVRIFDVTDPTDVQVVGGFLAYEREFRGGVNVALGDISGDGHLDVITGPGPGREPLLRVFDISVDPFRPSVYSEAVLMRPRPFLGGLRVAQWRLQGNTGTRYVITGSGPGDPPLRCLFVYGDPDSPRQGCNRDFEREFTGGTFVTAGDLSGDGVDDQVISKGGGGEPTGSDDVREPRVIVWPSEAISAPANFFAYRPDFTGGVRVAVADVDGDGVPGLITAAGPGGAPHIRGFRFRFRGQFLTAEPTEHSFLAYPQSFRGGVFVGGFNDAAP